MRGSGTTRVAQEICRSVRGGNVVIGYLPSAASLRGGDPVRAAECLAHALLMAFLPSGIAVDTVDHDLERVRQKLLHDFNAEDVRIVLHVDDYETNMDGVMMLLRGCLGAQTRWQFNVLPIFSGIGIADIEESARRARLEVDVINRLNLSASPLDAAKSGNRTIPETLILYSGGHPGSLNHLVMEMRARRRGTRATGEYSPDDFATTTMTTNKRFEAEYGANGWRKSVEHVLREEGRGDDGNDDWDDDLFFARGEEKNEEEPPSDITALISRILLGALGGLTRNFHPGIVLAPSFNAKCTLGDLIRTGLIDLESNFIVMPLLGAIVANRESREAEFGVLDTTFLREDLDSRRALLAPASLAMRIKSLKSYSTLVFPSISCDEISFEDLRGPAARHHPERNRVVHGMKIALPDELCCIVMSDVVVNSVREVREGTAFCVVASSTNKQTTTNETTWGGAIFSGRGINNEALLVLFVSVAVSAKRCDDLVKLRTMVRPIVDLLVQAHLETGERKRLVTVYDLISFDEETDSVVDSMSRRRSEMTSGETTSRDSEEVMLITKSSDIRETLGPLLGSLGGKL